MPNAEVRACRHAAGVILRFSFSIQHSEFNIQYSAFDIRHSERLLSLIRPVEATVLDLGRRDAARAFLDGEADRHLARLRVDAPDARAVAGRFTGYLS